MRRGTCGNLRRMRDGQHLHLVGKPLQPLTNRIRDRTTHTGVDFVEDKRRCRAAVGKRDLERQEETGELAARSDLHDRPRPCAGVCLDVELDGIDPFGRRRIRIARHLHHEPGAFQLERRKFSHHRGCEPFSRMTALLRQCNGRLVELGLRCRSHLLKLGELFLAGI